MRCVSDMQYGMACSSRRALVLIVLISASTRLDSALILNIHRPRRQEYAARKQEINNRRQKQGERSEVKLEREGDRAPRQNVEENKMTGGQVRVRVAGRVSERRTYQDFTPATRNRTHAWPRQG